MARAKRVFGKGEVTKACRAYADGSGVNAVAKLLGCCPPVAARVLRDNGVVIRGRGRPSKKS